MQLLCLPVDAEIFSREALTFSGLTFAVFPGRTQELHAKLLGCISKKLGVQEPGVHEMLVRQQIAAF